jgi:ACS family hexuronate transporter-like MFS transporter
VDGCESAVVELPVHSYDILLLAPSGMAERSLPSFFRLAPGIDFSHGHAATSFRSLPPVSSSASSHGPGSSAGGSLPSSPGFYRWGICALLFFATTFNYMDRQVISYLKEFFCTPAGQGGFGWSNTDFSNLTSAFTAFYAVMTIVAGWVIDKIGTKLGLAISLVVWSTFGILNAFVGQTVWMHIAVRSAFGIGEAGNFPASIKTVAEWFPKRERALATAIFNSGSNFGAMIAALFVPWCMIFYGDQTGWKMAFIFTGASGFVWLIFWFLFYEPPARQKALSKAEYDYIHCDDEAVTESKDGDKSGVSWLRLFRYRQTMAFVVGKFMTDGVWWFYLFWLPDYLKKQFGMTKHEVMLPTFAVYGVAIIGSVYGGSIPMSLIKKGLPVYKARMLAMLIIALFPLVVLSTQYFGNVSRFGGRASLYAVMVIAVGAAAHQAWAANLFTTVSDMFPKKAVGSVIGIGTAAGGAGGVIIQQLAGGLTDHFSSHPQTAYLVMFLVCGASYLIAWSIIKLLVPRHSPITDL